jgi:hypothetical protein
MTPSSLTSPSHSSSFSPPIPDNITQPSYPTIISPTPRNPVHADVLQATMLPQPQSPNLRPLHASFPELQPFEARLHSPSACSDFTQSSITSAVIDPSSSFTSRTRTARSDEGRSTTYDFVTGSDNETQLSTSRPMSPFSDIHQPRSPLETHQELQSLRSDSDGDFAILSPSLRSGMFSPPVNLDDDPFGDDDSIGSEDFVAWDDIDPRTPSP